jgi:hypothetical protein
MSRSPAPAIAALTLPMLVEGLYRTVLQGGGQGVGRFDLYVLAWRRASRAGA